MYHTEIVELLICTKIDSSQLAQPGYRYANSTLLVEVQERKYLYFSVEVDNTISIN
jgi:hypothetical protein